MTFPTFAKSATVQAGLTSPDDRERPAPTPGQDFELGAAPGGPNEVRNTSWRSKVLLSGDIQLNDGTGFVTVLNVPTIDANSLSFTFDQLMRPALCYQLAGAGERTTYLYWYDTTITSYTTIAIPSNRHAMMSFDYPKRPSLTGAEMIIAYIKAGVVYYRKQGDRFTVEYTFGTLPNPAHRISGLGLGKNWRLHIRLSL